MTSALVQALADNMTDKQIADMVGNYLARQLFAIVTRADNLTDETRPVEMAKVDTIMASPVIAAMPPNDQQKLKSLANDAKTLLGMDDGADDGEEG